MRKNKRRTNSRKKIIRFGDFIRDIRINDSRELTQKKVADLLEMSLTYYSDIECNYRNPFDPEKMEKFIEIFELNNEQKARIYDLASKENHEIPLDIEEIFMDDDGIGLFARQALRDTKYGYIEEESWKRLIREAEKNKRRIERGENGDKDEDNQNRPE